DRSQLLPALVGLVALLRAAGAAGAAEVKCVGPSTEAGTSLAVIVDAGPLAHTAQFLPLDDEGRLIGKGETAIQIEQVLANLGTALTAAGTDLDRAVKINVYATSPEVVAEVKKALARTFRGEVKPAVSFVTGKLAHPE